MNAILLCLGFCILIQLHRHLDECVCPKLSYLLAQNNNNSNFQFDIKATQNFSEMTDVTH